MWTATSPKGSGQPSTINVSSIGAIDAKTWIRFVERSSSNPFQARGERDARRGPGADMLRKWNVTRTPTNRKFHWSEHAILVHVVAIPR